ncbi:folE [Wigglesworthia glossinidia endosymbiont of Glossina brevipalpis]|uniref:GTP cyclohydrolase 1 n=1 Tax=Wigglesworthia glossinidia brevipalpis TaxID=36870 RepID=GCH1_WIGBR|nr:RecName: Full=GTP cyclohydrolase 1; AltName: Full=GTP cyclohydrolase I; Short=GTP-CH-I [Wigglesworthia glossinidia endosymbiont of Glossina brevipalpis]BAC24463.1 folE [Wigglesworthia glossinidia endosymbiont of Glossina brevipalpis]
MEVLTKEALLVKNALLNKGIETPFKKIYEKNKPDIHKISKYIKKIMDLLNLDLNNDSLSKTPNRIAYMYIEEIFSGLNYNNFPKITLIKNTSKINDLITVNNIVLNSTCEHHFLIFEGKAIVSYIPDKILIGLSKINRIVDFFSKRPQIQERLTNQILVAIQILLDTKNVAVAIKAKHLCVKARGIKDSHSKTLTLSLGGVFKSKQNIKKEFLKDF